MKLILGLVLGVFLVTGCVTDNVSHDDAPGAAKREEGPTLCKDGSTPPCNDRG